MYVINMHTFSHTRPSLRQQNLSFIQQKVPASFCMVLESRHRLAEQ